MTIVESIPCRRRGTHPLVGTGPSESQRAQPDWRTRYPARPVVTDWPATCADRDEVDRIVAAAAASASDSSGYGRHAGGGCRCCWTGSPTSQGANWQQRWMASGADAAGEDWARGPEQWLRRHGKYSENRLRVDDQLPAGRSLARTLVRPSLAWLLTGGKKRKLVRNMVYGRDGAGFDRLRRVM